MEALPSNILKEVRRVAATLQGGPRPASPANRASALQVVEDKLRREFPIIARWPRVKSYFSIPYDKHQINSADADDIAKRVVRDMNAEARANGERRAEFIFLCCDYERGPVFRFDVREREDVVREEALRDELAREIGVAAASGERVVVPYPKASDPRNEVEFDQLRLIVGQIVAEQADKNIVWRFATGTRDVIIEPHRDYLRRKLARGGGTGDAAAVRAELGRRIADAEAMIARHMMQGAVSAAVNIHYPDEIDPAMRVDFAEYAVLVEKLVGELAAAGRPISWRFVDGRDFILQQTMTPIM